jgi:hypothetical protein
MARRKALEWWETQIGNSEVSNQVLWLIAKSLNKRNGPKAPTAFPGPLVKTYHPNEEVNAITYRLEIFSRLLTCLTISMNGGLGVEVKF